jgi:hypothetical protein
MIKEIYYNRDNQRNYIPNQIHAIYLKPIKSGFEAFYLLKIAHYIHQRAGAYYEDWNRPVEA